MSKCLHIYAKCILLQAPFCSSMADVSLILRKSHCPISSIAWAGLASIYPKLCETHHGYKDGSNGDSVAWCQRFLAASEFYQQRGCSSFPGFRSEDASTRLQ